MKHGNKSLSAPESTLEAGKPSATKSGRNGKPLWTFYGGPRGTEASIYRGTEEVGTFRSPVPGAARRFARRIVNSLNSGKVMPR